MSTTVDSKVVEMQFDNDQFEKGVSESLSSLEKLKQALQLDDAASGFDSIDKAANSVSLDSISSSLETLEERFSTLGIVGMTVISELASSLLNTLGSAISSVASSIVSGGITRALNLEKAEFLLDGLLDDEAELELIMENVNAAVDGTAYSLDAAAMVASQLVASGVEAGDEMEGVLSGIAGVAAMTDSTYSDIGDIFTTVAGNGKLMTEQLRQFSSRGLNVAATLAEYLGTTEATVREMVTNGEIDFQTFADCMTDAFGDQAKKANETFTGACSNISSALARIGALFVSPLVERNGSIVDLLNTVRERINDVKTLITPFAETVTDAIISLAENVDAVIENMDLETPFEAFYNIVTIVTNAGKLLWQIISTIAKAFKEIFSESLASEVASITEQIAELTENFKLSDSQVDKLERTFSGLFSILDIVYQGFKSFIATVFPLTSIFGYIADAVLTVTAVIGDFAVILHDATEESGIIASISEGLSVIVDGVTGSFASMVGVLTGNNSLSDAVQNLLSIFSGGISGLNVISDALSAIISVFGEVLNAFNASDFSGIVEALDNLGAAASVSLSAFVSVVEEVLEEIVKLVPVIGEVVASLISTITDLIPEIGELIRELIVEISKTIIDCAPNISQALISLVTTAAAVIVETAPIIANAVAEVVLAVLEAFESYAPQIIDALIDLIDAVIEAIVAHIAGSKVGSVFLSVLSTIQTIASQIISAVSNLVSGIMEALGIEGLDDIMDSVETVGVFALFNKLFTFITSYKVSMKAFSIINDALKSVKEALLTFSSGNLISGAASLILKVAASLLILSVALTKISSIDSDKLASSMAALSVMFVELGAEMALLNTLTSSTKGLNTTLIAIGLAMVVLASAMTKLAALDWNGIAKGLVGIGGLMAEIYIFIKAINKLNVTKLSSTAIGLIILGAALNAMASACETFAAMSWGGVAKGLTGVGVLLGEVIIFMGLLKASNAGGSGLISTAAGIVILAEGLLIMSNACQSFGSMNIATIAKGLSSIAIVLAEVVAFTKLTGSTSLISTAAGLVVMGIAMQCMAEATAEFGSLDISELTKGLAAMGIALVEIAIAVKIMPNNLISIGAGLIIVGSALATVASVVGEFGNLTWDEIAKGLVAMGVSLAELAIGLNAMNGTLSGSAALLVGCTALTALVPVLLSLGSMSWTEVATGLIAIAGTFAILGAAGAILGGLAPSILTLSAALIVFGIAVVTIGVGVTALGIGLNTLNAAFITFAVSGVVGVAAAIEALKLVLLGIVDIVGELIVGICEAISSSVDAIGNTLKTLIVTLCDVIVECVPNIVETVLTVIDEVLSSLVDHVPSIVSSLMQLVTQILDAFAENLPTLIQSVMNVVEAFFSGIIDAINGLDTSRLTDMINGIGMLSAICIALAALGTLATSAMAGVLAMSAVIGELIVMLAAVGGIAQIPGLSWLISEGGDLLMEVGNAVGGFVGGFVGGIAEGITNSLPDIGTNLSDFMTNLGPFIDGATTLSPDMMDGVNALAESILLLTAADILDGIASWITGGSSMADFAEDLVPFGEAMVEFSDTVSGNIDSDTITAAANAGKTLAEMADTLPNSGGIAGWFLGENDMDTFGDQLEAFGEAMVSFGETIGSDDSLISSIETGAGAGAVLAEMVDSLPKSGGIVDSILGSTDMEDLSNNLPAFGTAISEFATNISGDDLESKIETGVACGKALSDLADSLPSSGGLFDIFSGTTVSMSDFATELTNFATAMSGFATEVDGIEEGSIQTGVDAGMALASLYDAIPDSSFFDIFTGGNMSSFSTGIGQFGSGLSSFASNISSISDFSALYSSATAGSRLATMAETIPSDAKSLLSNFADGIEAFGKGLDSFFTNVEGADIASASSAIKNLVANVLAAVEGQEDSFSQAGANLVNKLISGIQNQQSSVSVSFDSVISQSLSSINSKQISFQSSGTTLMSQFILGLDNKTSSVQSKIVSMLNKAIVTINSKKSVFKTAGADLINYLCRGIESKTSSVKSYSRSLGTAGANAVREKYSSFYSAGAYLVTGFCNGITANTYKAKAKAKAMATAAAQAAADALDENSPSKVGYEIGDYFGIGFVNGIENEVESAYSAGSEIASTATSALSSAIQKISDYISNGIDSDLTITPVLDLSNVESGAAAISGMFSSPSIGVMSNLSAISAADNARIQNGNSNEDVVNAINKMRKEMSGMGSTSNYNINGVTYDDGSNVSDAVKSIVRAARIERRK